MRARCVSWSDGFSKLDIFGMLFVDYGNALFSKKREYPKNLVFNDGIFYRGYWSRICVFCHL